MLWWDTPVLKESIMENELEKNAVDPTDPVEKKARELEKNGMDITTARKEADAQADRKTEN